MYVEDKKRKYMFDYIYESPIEYVSVSVSVSVSVGRGLLCNCNFVVFVQIEKISV